MTERGETSNQAMAARMDETVEFLPGPTLRLFRQDIKSKPRQAPSSENEAAAPTQATQHEVKATPPTSKSEEILCQLLEEVKTTAEETADALRSIQRIMKGEDDDDMDLTEAIRLSHQNEAATEVGYYRIVNVLARYAPTQDMLQRVRVAWAQRIGGIREWNWQCLTWHTTEQYRREASALRNETSPVVVTFRGVPSTCEAFAGTSLAAYLQHEWPAVNTAVPEGLLQDWSISADAPCRTDWTRRNLEVFEHLVNDDGLPEFFNIVGARSTKQKKWETRKVGVACQLNLSWPGGLPRTIGFQELAIIACLLGVDYEVAFNPFLRGFTSAWNRSEMKPPMARRSPLFFQYHMRSFCRGRGINIDAQAVGSEVNGTGVYCNRQDGEFKANNGKVFRFVERRRCLALYSTTELLESGAYVLTELTDGDDWGPVWIDPSSWAQYRLRPCVMFAGVAVLQCRLCEIIERWEKEWSTVLDDLDQSVDIHLEDFFIRENRLKLMYDDAALGRSENYFLILQLLRIFANWVQDTLEGFKELESICIRTISDEAAFRDRRGRQKTAAMVIIKANWKAVRFHQELCGSRLLNRISRKTEEMTSLRDGLFNAQSVKETTKGTQMNQYLMVFTIATILYLPPSFISTFYGMDLYVDDDNLPQTRTIFWTAFSVVSAATYLLAFLGIAGVRRREQLRTWLTSWRRPSKNSSANLKPDGAPDNGQKPKTKTMWHSLQDWAHIGSRSSRGAQKDVDIA
ncbi:hypothetical protein B0T19DRAFT_108016 [Cercophora scortea]|uniref:Uncharacterized protein n=1 Tax=Cercophora scortea TaxID=314031 RepID=A0AAE0IWT6_9PEZI|nr:hypothetical protein B0T19DRAFT_108016 [Cercophora scortea]